MIRLEKIPVFLAFLAKLLLALALSILDLFIWKKPKSVEGSTVVITGAAGGLGREIARVFTEHGAKVALLDFNEKANEELAAELISRGATAYALTCDVTKPTELEAVRRKIEQNPELGDPDIVVCNAGVLNVKALVELSDAQIRRTIEVNLLGYFWTIRAFLPRMLERNSGHLAIMCSVGGYLGESLATDYSASKFGVRGLIEALEWEIFDARKDVKVTSIHPFFTQTPMLNVCAPVSNVFAPPMPASFVAERAVDAILMGKREIFVPGVFFFLVRVFKGMMSRRVEIVVREFLGVKFK